MSEQKQPQRWYIVSDKKDGAACLVEASNKAQAYRRAGEFYCTARPATVDEALRMSRDGRDVIYAPTEPEQLDLDDNLNVVVKNSVVAGAESPAPAKEGATPEASGPSGASGPLTEGEVSCPACDQVHGAGQGGRLDESLEYPGLLCCGYCNRYYQPFKDGTLARIQPSALSDWGAKQEPELPKVTDIVPEAARKEDTSRSAGRSQQAKPTGITGHPRARKASDVFGAGFGPRDEPDVG